jgi:ABC-type transporter Mla MlaB component
MTLRIERTSGRRKTQLGLSGELRQADLEVLKSEIAREGQRVALDLEEVSLIDLEGIRFLNACEADGIEVLRCAPYMREWMSQERADRNDRAERKPEC